MLLQLGAIGKVGKNRGGSRRSRRTRGGAAGVPLVAAGGACREESGGLSRVLNEEQYIVPIGIGLGCVFLTWAFPCLFEPRNRTNNQISFPKN